MKEQSRENSLPILPALSQISADYIRSGKKCIVFVSSTLSPSTLSKINNTANYYGAPIFKLCIDSDELGKTVGKSAEIGVVCVTNPTFSEPLMKLCEQSSQ